MKDGFYIYFDYFSLFFLLYIHTYIYIYNNYWINYDVITVQPRLTLVRPQKPWISSFFYGSLNGMIFKSIHSTTKTENWWRTKMKDPWRSFTSVKASLSIYSTSTTACPPLHHHAAQIGLSLSLSFPDFIRLIRKNVFVVQIFRLCFCSNYGMLYFSTIEIKKHEREMNKEERRKEKDFFFFYSVGFFFLK